MPILDELRKKAIKRQYYWKDYYAVRHQFVAFKHRYAMTVHKAQGSTYREVFMDYDDMLLNNKLQERDELCILQSLGKSELDGGHFKT